MGHSIADLAIRTHTGASIVTVLRASGSIPGSEHDFVIEADDTLVFAGTADGLAAARTLLEPR